VQALLWLREYSLSGGPQALPAVLRAGYRTYAAHARFVTAASVPDIAFMVSGLVELYGVDPEASYDAMFGFLAQLVRGIFSAPILLYATMRTGGRHLGALR
jgi:Noc2p family